MIILYDQLKGLLFRCDNHVGTINWDRVYLTTLLFALATSWQPDLGVRHEETLLGTLGLTALLRSNIEHQRAPITQ